MQVNMNERLRKPFQRRKRRLLSLQARRGARCAEPALIFAFVFLLATPAAEEPESIATLKAERAQKLVDELRSALSLSQEVQIAVVVQHPPVFAVERAAPTPAGVRGWSPLSSPGVSLATLAQPPAKFLAPLRGARIPELSVPKRQLICARTIVLQQLIQHLRS
jgi:hypothetical protein